MKKALFTLATLILLASCSKQASDLAAPAPPVEPKEQFFSQVMRYKDGRTPGVDTVWTLRLQTQDMVTTYTALDGYLYDETSTYRKVGVLYSK